MSLSGSSSVATAFSNVGSNKLSIAEANYKEKHAKTVFLQYDFFATEYTIQPYLDSNFLAVEVFMCPWVSMISSLIFGNRAS